MKIELDRHDKISEIISAVLLLFNALLLIFILPTLPDAGERFNASSTLNGFNSKTGFWVFFLISLALYGFMTLVSFKPAIYKSRMTKNNVDEQYKLTSKMARNVKPFMLVAFLAITVFSLQSARGQWIEAQPFLFLIVFGLVITPCLYYAVKISKVQ